MSDKNGFYFRQIEKEKSFNGTNVIISKHGTYIRIELHERDECGLRNAGITLSKEQLNEFFSGATDFFDAFIQKEED
jgi:hypothetical protein